MLKLWSLALKLGFTKFMCRPLALGLGFLVRTFVLIDFFLLKNQNFNYLLFFFSFAVCQPQVRDELETHPPWESSSLTCGQWPISNVENQRWNFRAQLWSFRSNHCYQVLSWKMFFDFSNRKCWHLNFDDLFSHLLY